MSFTQNLLKCALIKDSKWLAKIALKLGAQTYAYTVDDKSVGSYLYAAVRAKDKKGRPRVAARFIEALVENGIRWDNSREACIGWASKSGYACHHGNSKVGDANEPDIIRDTRMRVEYKVAEGILSQRLNKNPINLLLPEDERPQREMDTWAKMSALAHLARMITFSEPYNKSGKNSLDKALVFKAADRMITELNAKVLEGEIPAELTPETLKFIGDEAEVPVGVIHRVCAAIFPAPKGP